MYTRVCVCTDVYVYVRVCVNVRPWCDRVEAVDTLEVTTEDSPHTPRDTERSELSPRVGTGMWSLSVKVRWCTHYHLSPLT